MLETVKEAIKNIPCISFNRYFTQYVLDVQDKNISEEVSFLIKNNFPNLRMFDQLVDSMHKGLDSI